VHFDIPEGEFPMVPDEDDDEATAMAMVNTDIEVGVNMPAIISATFLPDASPIGLVPGHNHPFEYVNWMALQSMVVTTGVTFAVQPVEIGANQVPLPIGAASLITCGPFECMMGPMPPAISIANSAACTAWDPEVTLQVGYVDNTAVAADATTTTADIDNDGVDIGWAYTSSSGMTVKHHFDGVTRGENFNASSPDVGKASSAAGIPLVVSGTGVSDERKVDYASRYKDAILFDVDDAGAAVTPAAGNSACASTTVYADGVSVSGMQRPDECFRVSTMGSATSGANYFGGYSLELTPKGADVGWGSEVQWEEDPFEDLECESKMYSASEMVDVCELFEEEVDAALGSPWAGSRGTSVGFVVLGGRSDTVTDVNTQLEWLTIPAPTSAMSRRFQTLRFANNDGGRNRPDTDIYVDTDDGTAGTQRAPLLLKIVDGDNDPMYGDFGKVDLVAVGADGVFNGASDPNFNANANKPDGNADNYDGDDAEKCSDADGLGCDAEFSTEIDVTFASGTALNCSVKKTVTISCEWDAQGLIQSNPTDRTSIAAEETQTSPFNDTTNFTTGTYAAGQFYKCSVSG